MTMLAPDFEDWLEETNIRLALTTYQRGRLIFVGRKPAGGVLMERAGRHTTGKLKVPTSLTIILLPARSRELNAVESIWQYRRANRLSNRIFENHEAIVDAGCEACNKLIAQDKKSSGQ